MAEQLLSLSEEAPSHHRRNSYGASTALDYKLKEHELDFTDYIPIKVHCITWNVNSSLPTDEIKALFDSEILPDILAFSIQEMDMSIDSVVLNDVKYEEEWIYIIRKATGKNYHIISYKRLAGIFLIILALNTHKEIIKYVSSSYAATGILGLMGNKGAVGISFDFYETSLCFVCSHFAAHQEEIEKRNQNFSLINHKMRFLSPKHLYPVKIDDHDVVFWCGDLNYRISNLTINQIMADIVDNRINLLLNNDQLNVERMANRVFPNYCEPKITFLPTYKFIPGSSEYDLGSNRLPAWCDRILWLENNKKCEINVVEYGSYSKITSSDHKPVFGRYNMKVCVIDNKKYNTLLETFRMALDAQENQMIPSIKISSNDIVFHDIHYKIPQVQTVTLYNNGLCDLHFQFLSRNLDIHTYDPEFCCPSWLTISQTSGHIPKGHSVTIAFEVSLTKQDVIEIDHNNPKLATILILHLIEGKDYFICVEGNYVPSCFGSSIHKISKLKHPIKARDIDINQFPPVQYDSICSRLAYKYDVTLIPKELVNLTNCLVTYGINTPGIFSNIGFFDELVSIMKVLDYSTHPIQSQFQKLSIHSVAEAYLLFLDMLKEPLIPVNYVMPELFTDGKINPNKFFKKLDNVRKITLMYVLCFIDEIIQHKPQNHADPIIIYTVFANVLIRYENGSVKEPKEIPVKNSIKIIEALIKYCVTL